jgi:adenylate cyclase
MTPRRLGKLVVALVGDDRRTSLEQRLFNSITLLNGTTNIAGCFGLPHSDNFAVLLALQLGTGVLFLALYALSRWRGRYRRLYWPFVLLTLGFVSANVLANAGTLGGAHYYLIPALIIAVVLSDRPRRTAAAVTLFASVTLALLLAERFRPGWFAGHMNPADRWSDVSSNFLFAQLFTGVLVIILMRNLGHERRKSDMLLLNILPEEIAEELKRNDVVQPVDYESTSVLFADIAGFTRIAEGLTPQQLVGELDEHFRHFDRVARRRNLEKIKTIGDAYMAVGGIPQCNGTHAVDCVLAALEIRDLMQTLAADAARQHRPAFQLRIGVHSGDLVAGVIGHSKFSYDVWGDTVNTASRLESAGAPGRVNISGATYAMVREFFACQHRGTVEAKNKGPIDMYFVTGILPECSVDGDGVTPNRRFAERYARLARGRQDQQAPPAQTSMARPARGPLVIA